MLWGFLGNKRITYVGQVDRLPDTESVRESLIEYAHVRDETGIVIEFTDPDRVQWCFRQAGYGTLVYDGHREINDILYHYFSLYPP